ncbi:TetR family transcriptional regulator [Mycobacterium sp. CBMA271]|nr:TetR family transcriptional regulator [Mycobacteroides sp. CBMA 271]
MKRCAPYVPCQYRPSHSCAVLALTTIRASLCPLISSQSRCKPGLLRLEWDKQPTAPRYDGPVSTSRNNGDKLLEGALSCLQERGYANITSRDIARAAGVNIASINYHFGSKDALMDEALTKCFSNWSAQVQLAFDQAAATNPRDQIQALFHATIDSFDRIRPTVYACIEFHAPAMRSDKLRERLASCYAGMRDHAVDLARTAMLAHGFEPPESLHTAVSLLMALIEGLMLQWAADPSAVPDSTQITDGLAALGALAVTAGSD